MFVSEEFRETRELNSITLYNETTVILETIDKISLFKELISKYHKIMRDVSKALQCLKEKDAYWSPFRAAKNYWLGITGKT